jgi:hypothetical protein
MKDKPLDFMISIREVIRLSATSNCIRCYRHIDIEHFHVPLCRKCRELYLNEDLKK